MALLILLAPTASSALYGGAGVGRHCMSDDRNQRTLWILVIEKVCVCAKIFDFAGGVQKTEFGTQSILHSESIAVGKLCKAATISLWTLYQCAQTLHICLLLASTMT